MANLIVASPPSCTTGQTFPISPVWASPWPGNYHVFDKIPAFFLFAPKFGAVWVRASLFRQARRLSPKCWHSALLKQNQNHKHHTNSKAQHWNRISTLGPSPKICPIFHFGAMYHYIFLGDRIMLEIYQNPEFSQLTDNLISLRYEEESSPVKRSEER